MVWKTMVVRIGEKIRTSGQMKKIIKKKTESLQWIN